MTRTTIITHLMKILNKEWTKSYKKISIVQVFVNCSNEQGIIFIFPINVMYTVRKKNYKKIKINLLYYSKIHWEKIS